MKIYIVTDMEGISGIWSSAQTQPGTPQYEEGRKLMMADVNAAIEGALASGAAQIIVNDGHGGGPHFLLEEMHPAARYERPQGAHNYLPGLDETCSAVFLIGLHAMAGTQGAFLDHTQSGTWFNYSLNGRLCGEIGQVGATAGPYGVPVVLVTGDDKAAEEARQFFPGAETVAVKEGLQRNLARCLQPSVARDMIREAARRAVAKVNEVKPWRLDTPIEVILETTSTEVADSLAGRPGVERIGPRTVRKIAPTALDILCF